MRMMQLRWSVAAGLLLTTAGTLAQAPPPPPPPQQATPPPAATATPAVPPGIPADYTFSSGAGLLFYYVQPAKVAEFDAVIGRVREALLKAETPQRKQQALNWKIYKSAETTKDAVIYVFAMDPAMTTASYDPLLLIAEVLPSEVQPLYARLKEAVIKVERMGLTKIR